MAEICIPIPDLNDGQKAEITVAKSGNQDKICYRVVTFPGTKNQMDNNLRDEVVFTNFKQFIDTYDKKWELLQVIASQEERNTIQLLYRKR